MEAVLKRIKGDLKEYRHALSALTVYFIIGRVCFRAFCPFVIVTGLPCPGCGLSRACLLFLTGQFSRSLFLHPLGAFWLFLLCSFFWNRYVLGKPCRKWMLWMLALLSAATFFVYLVRMVRYFPMRPPMSYTGRNLFEKLIPGYRQKILSFWNGYVKL